MADLNKVMLIGNLTRDPEVRYTPKGTAVGDLAMALNNSFKSQDGQVREEVCYVDLVVWGRQAETAKQYLSKGSPIFVEGRLQLDQWETKEGEKRNRLRVVAERIQFLGRPREGGGGGGGGAPRGEGRSGGDSYNQAPPRSQAPAYEAHEPGPSDDDVPF
ncbi:MAG: single-stranded DNA-binding protein [Verrucomicrobium sp.]|nr:single-stranded DNA-binding protein [Verrucomicrobium sp.]